MFSRCLGLLLILGFTSTAPAATWDCGGTEPFWSMKIEDRFMFFNHPDLGETNYVILREMQSMGTKDPTLVIKSMGLRAIAVIRPNPACSDGMSEEKYTHDIVLIRGNDVFTGCCVQK